MFIREMVMPVQFFPLTLFSLFISSCLFYSWSSFYACVTPTFVSCTFMLPYIVIDFFLNNQPDALIIPILFCYKTTCFGHLLCPSSGVFCCTFGTGKFHAGF